MYNQDTSSEEPSQAPKDVNVAAALWIKPIPCSRGTEMTPSMKLTLMALWDHAKWAQTEPVAYLTTETLAKRVGMTKHATRGSLGKLGKLKWVTPVACVDEFDGAQLHGWKLAWKVPFTHEQGGANQ